MSNRKRVVEEYFEGFRHGDHARILRLLTDDVAWDLPGFKHLVGKAAFDGEIENDAFVGRPTLTVDRVIEEGESVVALGEGAASMTDGPVHHFAFADVFTFRGELICRVESYLVPLSAAGEG
jgi:ketosteroid isomerase-like protein